MGGLAAALLLSGRAEVTVLERRDRAGGKIRAGAAGGALTDIGPTVLTMKWVFDDLFARAGADFGSEVPAERLGVLARHAWRDGSRVDLLDDDRAAADAVGRFAGAAEMRGFNRFLADARRILSTLRDCFLRAPAADMIRLMTGAGPLNLLGIDPFSNYASALKRYFRDPRLFQLFARYATYCGSSPYKAPATLMLIAAVEKDGVWAPEGGMTSLAKAAERIASAKGVRFLYGQEVAEVLVSRGRAAGLRTLAGDEFGADAVILNVDAAAVASGLLGPAAAGAVRPPGARSQSAITFLMSATATGFPLHRHNVFFSRDYKAEFDAVFGAGTAPPEPTTYIWAKNPAADGRQPLFCLVNAPAWGARPPADEIERVKARMIDQLAGCGLALGIDAESAMTPADFARDYPGTDGAIYGAPSHGWRATFQRPGVRTRVPGLYLAGGSVHPGPGVPMAALSGMAAATCLMNDFGLTGA